MLFQFTVGDKSLNGNLWIIAMNLSSKCFCRLCVKYISTSQLLNHKYYVNYRHKINVLTIKLFMKMSYGHIFDLFSLSVNQIVMI